MNIGIDYISTLLLIAAIVAVRRLKFRSVLHSALMIRVIVSSCTIDLSQSSAITPAAKTAIPSPVVRQGNPTEQNPNVIRSFPTTTIPVTWGDLANKRLDAAVFAAYGWKSDLSDEEILDKRIQLWEDKGFMIVM